MPAGLKIENAVVLVTGANRGIGRALVDAALQRGASKVYAAMRTPRPLGLPRVEEVVLDVTSETQVRDAAARCTDVTLVINNAGIADPGGFLAPESLSACQRHIETNVYGLLRMAQAFAPVLAARGGGAMLNILSVASWINSPMLGAYGLSKAAAWALTNGLRIELREQNTLVAGLHVGFVDTDLARQIDMPKLPASEVAERALAGIEAGEEEILVGERALQIKRGLTADPPVYLALGRR